MLKIPIASTDPHFTQENEIFGHSFSLEFEWIERENFWLLHIFDNHQAPLALGLKIQVDWPLYVHYQDKGPVILMLIATELAATLDRQTLKQHFVLVVYEAI
jgi:hypothetical protein